VNTIPPVVNTSNIRIADFVRVNTGTDIYRFTTSAYNTTVTAVDALPFIAVGTLIKVGDVQRDIKSTANETTVTLVGIDATMLGWVLSQSVKGAYMELWHGFYNTDNLLLTTGGTGGLYQFFSGIITSFTISESWMEQARSYVGTITVSASAIQLILQNRIAGRYTNNNSWQFFTPNDTSMNRVNYIQTINYAFGKTV